MIIRVLTAIALIYISFPAYALEDVPPAVPAPAVKAEALPLPAPKKVKALPKSEKPEETEQVKKPQAEEKTQKKSLKYLAYKPKKSAFSTVKGFYVLELFSSQACTFCPKADAIMKAYIDQPYMIALSCHVDYYDVIDGALSLPICSARQNTYEISLDTGPKYIPQMVVNGEYNATGYLTHEIAEAFKQARPEPITPISVEKIAGGLYNAHLPEVEAARYNIWLYVYEKPKTVKVQDGGNAGKNLTYYNLVSKAGFLGLWDGSEKDLKFDAKLGGNAKGFALLVQRADSNGVVLAAKVE